jgi:hypothetical protein
MEGLIDRSRWVIFYLFSANTRSRRAIRRTIGFRGSSLPIPNSSAISPTFIARLIKGCRVDASAGCFSSEKT